MYLVLIFIMSRLMNKKTEKRLNYFQILEHSDKLSFGIGFQTINTKDDVGYIEKRNFGKNIFW